MRQLPPTTNMALGSRHTLSTPSTLAAEERWLEIRETALTTRRCIIQWLHLRGDSQRAEQLPARFISAFHWNNQSTIFGLSGCIYGGIRNAPAPCNAWLTRTNFYLRSRLESIIDNHRCPVV